MNERELAFAPVVLPKAQKLEHHNPSASDEIPPSAGRMLGMMLNLVVGEMKANREFMAKALDLLANQPMPEFKLDLPKTEINFPEAILNTLERPITVTMPQPAPIQIEVEE